MYDQYAPYSEQIRIPFLFQGQYYDHETELAYNRFRYYSPELGRYISEDPIGLDSGECNLFSYVENPTILLDLFGLAPWGAGEQSFDLWWKKAKQKTVQKHIASVKRHLRAGGGKHEMFPVSIAMDAKRLGFTPSELRNMTLNTEDVVFHYGTYRGKHHKSTASSLFHQDLIAQLKVAKTKTEALRIIEDMHEKHVVGYKSKKIDMAKMHFWVGWFPTEQEFLQYVGLGNDQSNDSSAELSSFAKEVGADEFEPDFCIAKYLNESDDVVEFARFVPTSTENILEKCMSFGLKKVNSLLCYNLRAGISDEQAEHAGLLNYLGIHPYSTRAIESRFSTSGMEFSTFVGTISQSVEEFMEYFNQDDYLNALELYRQGKTKKRPNPNLRCQFCKDVGLDFYYPQLLRIAFSQELKLVDAESLVQEVLIEPFFYDVLPYHLKDANINMANCAFCYIANGFRKKDKDQHISIYMRNSPTLIKRKKKDIDELDNYNELQFLGNLVWE